MIVAKQSRIKSHWRVVLNATLLLLCIILAISIGELSNGYKAAENRLHYVSEANKKVQHQNSDLRQELEDLTTPDGLEYYVRNHYRALVEGESLVVVVDPRERVTLAPLPKPSLIEKIRTLLHIP